MKSRGGLGREVRELPLSPLPLPRFYFFALLLLRTAPHYLNAWNRLNAGIKVTSAELARRWGHVIRPFNTVSCIVTQFARETFEICRFRGSCMREIDLI